VKQIVGGTLTDSSNDLKTNYVSNLPAGHYAKLYKDNDLTGAHVIMLGPGNEEAATEALAEWPGGLQVGGGITDGNAAKWIEKGANKVCTVSYQLPNTMNGIESLAVSSLSSLLSLLIHRGRSS
jgi:phosphoribosylformimino-5-aminoimidazole carboxamide ribotide isomerase